VKFIERFRVSPEVPLMMFSRNPSMLCSLFLVLLAAGCGGPVPETVDPDLGMQTLKSTLEQWKQGTTPDALAKQTPEVIVQDMDWSSGLKLVAFETLDSGQVVDANLRIRVKLTTLDQKDKTQEKTVSYVVTTRPKLTVFRDMLN
jgi:hypothetical protein